MHDAINYYYKDIETRIKIYTALLELMNSNNIHIYVLDFGLCAMLREEVYPKLQLHYESVVEIEKNLPELWEEKPEFPTDSPYWWKRGDVNIRINAVQNALEKTLRNGRINTD